MYFCICLLLKNEVPYLLHWLGILIFIYAVTSWKYKMNSRWICPYSIVQIFFLAFNYGQPVMWALGIHRASEIGSNRLYYKYTPTSSEITEVELYVCAAMLIFHFGALWFAKKNNVSNEKNKGIIKIDNKKWDSYKACMRKVFGISLCILSPIILIFRFSELLIARQYGYKALYYGEHSTQGGYIQILIYMFLPSLLGYLIGSDYSKKARVICYSIWGAYAILGLLAGDRGSWVYSLCVLLLLHVQYKPLKPKQFFLTAIGLVLGIYFLSGITAIRDTGLGNITSSQILSGFSAEESPVVSTFFEMGGSMAIITFLLHTGNSIYPYGSTYLTSILGLVSSRFLSIIGMNNRLVADWFTDYLGMSSGTGFSMIGEAYLNGGYFGGLIYMFIIGALYGRILSLISEYSISKTNPLRFFIGIAGMNAMLNFIRGALYLTLKEFLYGTLIFALIIEFIVETHYKGRKHNESFEKTDT